MELPPELGPERRPVALEVVPQVVVVGLEVLGYVAPDVPGEEVPQLGRIAVFPRRPESRFPDRELLAGPRVAAQHRLELALHPHADAPLTRDLPFSGHFVTHPLRHRTRTRSYRCRC